MIASNFEKFNNISKFSIINFIFSLNKNNLIKIKLL